MKTITGMVLGIIYANAENGYAVLEIDADSDFFVAVGIFPPVEEGELLTMTGELMKNPKFGEQFVVEKVEFAKPDTKKAIIKYLGSGLFEGIGPVLAQEIVSYFGIKTMDIIENEPKLLKKVHGVGEKKLIKIVESYKKSRQMKESIFFLQKYEISMNLALKIYNSYGDNTIEVIKQNPYALVTDIEGVGFLIADRIAGKIGVESNSEFRIKAGLYHTLKEASNRGGHTCLPENILLSNTAKLINIDDIDVIKKCLEDIDDIKFTQIDNIRMVSTSLNYSIEKSIASKLLALNISKEKWNIDIKKELDIYQTTSKIVLHKHQKEAIDSIFNNGVSVITGGPGTGKTTIIKGIVNIIENNGMKVALCAPTGRASKRMSEATGCRATTIHRMLGLQMGAKGEDRYTYNKTNPMEIDVLIVDEISMADIYIFNALVSALAFGARLLLVGDKNQLPSVSCGNILADIINSKMFNVVSLTEVYRQAKDSMIVVNAHRINDGFMPTVDGAKDFFIDNKNESLDILNAVIGMTKSRIPNFLGITSNDIQVLCPVKKGIIGVNNLNIELQKALNKNIQQLEYKDTIFRLGDRVMHIVNNYNLEWEDIITKQEGKGVFNGDIGYINAVNKDNIVVLFDDNRIVNYERNNLEELNLAYSVSIHKSQGSEFDVAIVVIGNGNSILYTRNLLYTAVTRAKKLVVIVGSKDNIMKMINNNYTAKRYSLLKQFLVANKDKLSKLWGDNEQNN
ncbi:MAG: ATP-dependent RecD-like DNA helicase [Clostridia bacterium]